MTINYTNHRGWLCSLACNQTLNVKATGGHRYITHKLSNQENLGDLSLYSTYDNMEFRSTLCENIFSNGQEKLLPLCAWKVLKTLTGL